MANTNSRVDIRDVWTAAQEGIIAGKFTPAGGVEDAVFVFDPVVRRGRRGNTQTWTQRVSLHAATGAPMAFTPALIGEPPHPALPEGAYAEIDVDYRTLGTDDAGAEVAGEARKRPPKRVEEGKRAGTVRATNAASQALLDAASEHRKKLRAARADTPSAPDAEAPAADAASATKKGAKRSPAGKKAPSAPAAPMPLFYPMLVQSLGKTKTASLADEEFASAAGVFVQPKLDGVRVVARDDAAAVATSGLAPEVVAEHTANYTLPLLTSRTAKPYPGLDHVRRALAPLFAAWRACETAAGRPGVLFIDGEVFVPGQPLNYISGKARKANTDDSDLEYHVFDAYDPARPDAPYAERREWVDQFFAGADALAAGAHAAEGTDIVLAADAPNPTNPTNPIKRVETVRVVNAQELDELYQRYLAQDYEGAIARRGARAYELGARNYHSSALLKLKPRPDAEFRVVGFGKGTGSHAGAVIWVCEVPADQAVPDAKTGERKARTFKVGSMRGWSLEDRRRVYSLLSEKVPARGKSGKMVTRFARDFANLSLTVEFAGLSAKTGVPLQPRGVGFKRTAGPTPEDLPAGADPIRALLSADAATK